MLIHCHFKNTRTRLGVFLFSLLLLHACSHTPQTKQLPQSRFAELATELESVPFFPQTQYQCGPAALATVMQYRGIDILPETLVSKIYIPEKKGSLQIEMVSATREQGLVPYVIAPKMTALLAQIEAGHPVLVMQNLAYQWMPYWHYAVVVGFDVTENQLILRSGENKRWKTTFAAFERTWARSDYWGLVILPPETLPANAALARWLAAAYDLQQTGQIKTAQTAYQTALLNWPESAEAAVALANLLYQQQQFDAADKVYADILNQKPQNATLWNNRAYTLQALSCPYSAKKAAQCAANFAPENVNIQGTVNEILQNDASNASHCPSIDCNG